jgi:hypothetical protein
VRSPEEREAYAQRAILRVQKRVVEMVAGQEGVFARDDTWEDPRLRKLDDFAVKTWDEFVAGDRGVEAFNDMCVRLIQAWRDNFKRIGVLA